MIVHACIVSRDGYLKRYLNKYGENTWEMMKSAFSIAVERAAKYAALKNGTLMVYFESAGKKEDTLLKQYFNELRLKDILLTAAEQVNIYPYQLASCLSYYVELTVRKKVIL